MQIDIRNFHCNLSIENISNAQIMFTDWPQKDCKMFSIETPLNLVICSIYTSFMVT